MTALPPPGTADLDALEEALGEASKAPWGLVGGTHDRDVIDDHGCHVAAAGTFPDAAAIVAAVNAAPLLIAELRDLRAREADLRLTVARVRALVTEHPPEHVPTVPLAELARALGMEVAR